MVTLRTKIKAPTVLKKVPGKLSYESMIIAAINALKERKGSSRSAVKKYIMANYDVTPGRHFDSQISAALVRGQSKEVFSFPKGLSGTIKLVKPEKPSEEVIKEEEKKEVKEVATKRHTRTNRHLRKSKRVIPKKPVVREIRKTRRMTATAKKARAKLPEEVTVNIEKKPTKKPTKKSEKKSTTKKRTTKKITEKANIKAPKLTKRQAAMKKSASKNK